MSYGLVGSRAMLDNFQCWGVPVPNWPIVGQRPAMLAAGMMDWGGRGGCWGVVPFLFSFPLSLEKGWIQTEILY